MFLCLVFRLFLLPSLQWHVTTLNAAPRPAGMWRKCSRALRTLFFTRTTTKLKRLNLSRYFGNFRGSLGDLRVLMLVTITTFLAHHRVVGDFLCFQQADKNPLRRIHPRFTHWSSKPPQSLFHQLSYWWSASKRIWYSGEHRMLGQIVAGTSEKKYDHCREPDDSNWCLVCPCQFNNRQPSTRRHKHLGSCEHLKQ